MFWVPCDKTLGEGDNFSKLKKPKPQAKVKSCKLPKQQVAQSLMASAVLYPQLVRKPKKKQHNECKNFTALMSY